MGKKMKNAEVAQLGRMLGSLRGICSTDDDEGLDEVAVRIRDAVADTVDKRLARELDVVAPNDQRWTRVSVLALTGWLHQVLEDHAPADEISVSPEQLLAGLAGAMGAGPRPADPPSAEADEPVEDQVHGNYI